MTNKQEKQIYFVLGQAHGIIQTLAERATYINDSEKKLINELYKSLNILVNEDDTKTTAEL